MDIITKDHNINEITVTEFKNNPEKYIDYVMDNNEEHNEIIITVGGKKYARLMPVLVENGLKDNKNNNKVNENVPDYHYAGKRVSYDEFMHIYEKSELRMEYINGEILLLASPGTFHQIISGNLYNHLRSYLKDKKCKAFFAPFDVHFFKQGTETPDVMQPDLLIACDLENTVNEKGRYMGIPTICFEIISESTRSRDMVDKLNTYMLSGVREFWIIDPFNHSVLIYSFNDYEINNFDIHKMGDTAVSFVFEGLEITLAEIFAE